VAQTILSVLTWAKGLLKAQGIDSFRIDAELLLAHILGVKRIDLIIHRDRPLTEQEFDEFQKLLARRIKREPIAYIIGAKEFFGRVFQVNPHVLIPRPETEALVEHAVLDVPKEGMALEIGVGSGAVIVTLLCERGDLIAYGNDISAQAVRTARSNARTHGVSDRLHLFVGDAFSALKTTFSMILANPPYITVSEVGSIDDDIALYEPLAALFGGNEGLDIVKEIISEAPRYLVPGGMLIMEVGHGHKDTVDRLIAGRGGLKVMNWVNDLAGIPRTVVIERVHG
jgi:release factor glutamine methyltransferase